MERLTLKQDDGTSVVSEEQIFCGESHCSGPAIEKLAAYEDMQEMLEQQYTQVAERLEMLKAEGKLKTSSAQQLLAQKLTYSSMLNLIDLHSARE